MKKLLVLFLCTASFIVNANNHLPNHRHIAVTGKSVFTTKPDMAEIKFDVQSIAETSLLAKRSVDQKVNKFIDGLSKFKISPKHLSASSIVTEANAVWDDNDNEIIDGYVASRTLTVTLSDIALLNDFLDFALSVELNTIDDITLKSSKNKELKKQAKQQAIEHAKQRAKDMAEAFNATIGNVYSIDETGYSSGYSYRFGGYASGDVERIEVTGSHLSRDQLKLTPGKYLEAEITYSESVRIVFDLVID